jgi:GNAT superfamily N-acetyltransferase
MTPEPLPGELRAFAEDPGAFVAIGPDEERILTDRYSVTFTPGEHFWSASVQRLRFSVDEVAGGVAEIRGLMADRGRTAAAWTVGPSATPEDLRDLLLVTGMKSESGQGSLILVLTEPPHVRSSPFDVRLVTSYEDHVAAIEVANQGFAFPGEDALDELRRARASFASERAGGHSVRLLAVDRGRPVAAGRAWLSPLGLYLGGGATIPSDRRRGAMSALVARAWEEAVDRGTPALVTFGGTMAAAGLQRIGFRAVGRVWHLVDRIDG